MSKEYKIYNEDNELVAKGQLLEILQLLINLGYRIEENKNGWDLDEELAQYIEDNTVNYIPDKDISKDLMENIKSLKMCQKSLKWI